MAAAVAAVLVGSLPSTALAATAQVPSIGSSTTATASPSKPAQPSTASAKPSAPRSGKPGAPGRAAPPASTNPLLNGMAAAMKQAKKSHKPVRVDVATNPYTTLTADPAGHFTAQEFLNPQRAKVNGSWQPIDTTLVKNADGSISSKVTLASVKLSGGGTGPLAVVNDGAGHALTFTWPGGALPAPTLSGDTATYANVYPGVDLQLVALPSGVQDVFVVHNAKAAANPALKHISLGVTGTGLSVGSTADGGVTAKDAKGHQVFGGPAPTMWDSAAAPAPSAATGKDAPSAGSAARPHMAKMQTTISHGSVTVTPDQSLLTSPTTVWPLRIDPQWVENPQNWLELWSNGNSVYDGNPWPYSPYDTSAVRVGNTGGTLVRSLMSFSAFNLPKPSDFSAHPGDQSQNVSYVTGAFLNLISQSATCPSTQAWRANPFNTDSNWSNQDGGSNTDLWPTSGSDFTNPISTFGGSTNCKGSWFSVNITKQVQDVYNSGGSTYTIGLRAANEGSTTNNYGSYFVQNAGGSNPNVTVNFVSEPWWGSPTVTNTPVGNHNGSKNPCGSTEQTAGYLPVQAADVGISIPLNDLDSREVSWSLMANDYPSPDYFSSTLTTGYGYNVAPTTVTGKMLTQVSPTGGNGYEGSPITLQDGHTYDLWAQALDDEYMTNGTFVNPNGQDLYNAWSNNGNDYPAPSSPPCWFTAALTPPHQPTITQSTFPATGQQLASYPTVGTGGTITVNATAPTTGIDHFDWALNTTSTNEGAGNCTGIANAACGTVDSSTAGTTGLGTTNATVPITLPSGAGNGEHWGTNYLYVSAVDKAGNVSAYARYDFFLAQAFQPVSFGNVTGDGIPNLMGADKNGNLIIYPANLDPAGSVNAVEAAPAASAPNGSSWSTALITHRGAERVQPTDDLFAYDKDSSGNGHMSYYFNSQTASASTQPGYTPPTTLDAFAKTQQALVTRPTCTPGALNGGCVGYDPTWNSVQQIVALGPVRGGCTISAPTTACKTNLVTVENYQGTSRVWMFSPAGTGQLTNPVLLSVSQPGWDWSRMRVMAPGNAAGHSGGSGGMPDLWAEDPAGTLWQFTNHTDTGTLGAGLGDLSTKQQLGTTGQFAPYTWVNTAGDLNADGNPDLWAMSPDGQVSVLLGPIAANPAAQGQTTATAINWGATAGVSNLQGSPIAPGGIKGQIVSDVTGGPSGQKCVDDEYGSTNNGTTIELYDCNGTGPQQWAFGTDGTIRFMGGNGQQTTCMDTSGSLVQATKVTLQACDLTNRASYQTWRIIPSPSAAGHYWIYNPAAGMCLDDSGGSNNNLNPFQLWPCWDSAVPGKADPAQRFVLPTGAGQTQSVEAESTWGSVSGPATQTQGNCCGISLSNGNQLYFPGNAQGQSVTLNYFVANAGTYSVTPALTKTNDRGQFSLTVDTGTAQSTTLPVTYDAYQASGVSIVPVHFGTVTLSAGMHSFTFTATGTNAASAGNRYVIGIDTLNLVPTATNGPSLGLNIPSTGMTGVPVTADATASYPGTTAVTGYSFDFGDGTVVGPQATASANHTYTTAGTYQVKVTATDAGGVTAVTSATVVVTGGATNQWKLSDGSGTTAADTGSTGGDPGTLSSSGVTWNPNGSAAFDGTGQITAAPTVDTSKSFSAAAWVNLRDTTNYHFVLGQTGTNMESFYLDYDPPQHSWAMVMPTSDTSGPGWTWAAAPASDVSLNTWTHLVGTFDANTGTIRLYVNGQPAGTGTTHAAWNSATKTGSALVIGASDRAGTFASRFNGSIADARVYQQTLTPDQASWLYQNSAFAPKGASGPINSPTLTGKCIDDYYGGQTNGTHVNEWDCNGSSPQNWTMNPNGTITLTASNGTKCLDIIGGPGATANGTLVQLYDCNGWANQQWVAQSDGNGNVHLLNPNSGRCLDDPGGSLSNGTQLQIYDCLGNANQAWTPPLGTNLAAGGAATASSQTTGWEATHLTDGIYRGTGAVPGYASQLDGTANADEWAKVDLGGTHQIGEVDLYPRDEASNTIGAGFPVTFTIQVSTDGANWTTVANEVNYTKPGDSPQQFRFNATSARYVKVNATVLGVDQNGNHYLELRQIGVQGT